MKSWVRHLLVVGAFLAAAATVVGGASASPFRPATQGLPFARTGPPSPGSDGQTCIQPGSGLAVTCYSPQDLQRAYNFPTGHNAPTGAGQTIVVVDAYGSPFLADDLDAYTARFGLPPVQLTEIDQQTPIVTTPPDQDDPGSWALETTLDIELAHAVAPGANIVLAVAINGDSTNLVEVQREVLAQYPSAIVTQSFGGDETGLGSDPVAMDALDALFAAQVAHGGTVVAAAGDYGATNGTIFVPPFMPRLMVSYPAASPFVVAVGGTEGNPYPGGLLQNGRYGGEQVWNEVLNGVPGATGGGESTLYPAPAWQTALTGATMRTVPDVAYNAAANGGSIIVFRGQTGAIGGTSASAPQWAGIVALANELRARKHRGPVGLLTPMLYEIAQDRNAYRQDFHDITVGTNALQYGPLPGLSAGPGYDETTGLGTPDVSRLLADLDGRNQPHFGMPGQKSHGRGGPHGSHVRFGPGR